MAQTDVIFARSKGILCFGICDERELCAAILNGTKVFVYFIDQDGSTKKKEVYADKVARRSKTAEFSNPTQELHLTLSTTGSLNETQDIGMPTTEFANPTQDLDLTLSTTGSPNETQDIGMPTTGSLNGTDEVCDKRIEVLENISQNLTDLTEDIESQPKRTVMVCQKVLTLDDLNLCAETGFLQYMVRIVHFITFRT